jgi:hypothetical protein
MQQKNVTVFAETESARTRSETRKDLLYSASFWNLKHLSCFQIKLKQK